MATNLPAPQSYIVDTTVDTTINGTGVNYSRTLQEVPIIAENSNIYVTENVTQNVFNNSVRIVSPDFVTANAIATEPPLGRKPGSVYFNPSENILYAWNGAVWYKVGETLNNVITGNVVINGNLTTIDITSANITSNNITSGGNITSAGTVTGGNIISTNNIGATGNLTGGNVAATGNLSGGNITSAGNISGINIAAGGNLAGNDINAVLTINAGGNITGGNITANANISAVNTNTGNLVATGNAAIGGTASFGSAPVLTFGTPNTVLYVDATNTMVSGPQLSFDGSNLGVGIQPATANIDVNGTGRVRSNLNILGVGDGLTITPQNAGIGTLVSSRNQSFSGYVPLITDSSTFTVRPNGLTPNLFTVTTTGSGVNTATPLSTFDANGVVTVSGGGIAPIDFRPYDDTAVNWRLGGYTTASKQGVLQLINNGTGAGGGGTEVITVDQTNNIGVGTVGPLVQYNTANPNARMNINGIITGGSATSTSGSVILQGRNGAVGATTNIGTENTSGGAVVGYAMIPSTGAPGQFTSSVSTVHSRSAITVADGIRMYTGGSQTVGIGSAVSANIAVSIDTSGNVGLKKAIPLYGLDLDGNAMVNLQNAGDYSGVRGAGGGNASLYLQSNQTAGAPFWITAKTDSTLHIGGSSATEPGVGAITIDALDNISVGASLVPYKFSIYGVKGGKTLYSVADSGVATDVPITAYNVATVGDNALVDFQTDGGVSRGSITFNRAASLVAYNTTSDYRAKELLGPVSNSGALIDSLQVYNGRMHGATIERPMLVAHEAQAVTPWAVTGEKDAVDDSGNPIYQKVDHSSLVPLLIAEIQELRKRVAILESR